MQNIHVQILSEMTQSHDTRKGLYVNIEKKLGGRTLVAIFSSFTHPVSISDAEANMLQSILQHTDTSKGIVLMVNSPGGDGLAAERIVNTCRTCSGTGDYWAIIPGKAKSAATLIAMGASKIMMPPTAELGPVDPQIFKVEDGTVKSFSAYSLVQGYDRLLEKAVNSKKRIEPYLQQLKHYDDREMNEYRSYIKLSDELAIKILTSGMLSGFTADKIKKELEIFLIPEAGTIAHGRPIFGREARKCGLNVEDIDVNSKLWQEIYKLYARLDTAVHRVEILKIVENKEESFNG